MTDTSNLTYFLSHLFTHGVFTVYVQYNNNTFYKVHWVLAEGVGVFISIIPSLIVIINSKMPLKCKYCDKMFSRQSSTNRHIREIHMEQVHYAKEVWGFKCLEPDCDTSFQQGLFLIDHLEKVHNLKFESETIIFENMDEFTNWKQSIEEVSCSYYVISKNKKDRGITYFNCNRSKTGHNGHRKLDTQYKRNCKSQGSCHINSSCTSQIKLFCDIDGKVTVNFRKTHYGHVINLAQVRLPKYEREKIAAKLVNGDPPKKIVQEVHGNIGEHLKRIDLLTMRDVNNIKRSFGLKFENGKQQENDAVSLDLWVQENDSKMPDENPITYYKKQGTESPFLKLKLNKKINHVFCKLKNFDYNTLDDSTLEKIHDHLNAIENLTNLPQNMVIEENDFVITEDTNKRYINPQLCFFSTKKKKASTSCTINSSDMERLEIKKMLQNKSALIISSSSTQDHMYCKI